MLLDAWVHIKAFLMVPLAFAVASIIVATVNAIKVNKNMVEATATLVVLLITACVLSWCVWLYMCTICHITARGYLREVKNDLTGEIGGYVEDAWQYVHYKAGDLDADTIAMSNNVVKNLEQGIICFGSSPIINAIIAFFGDNDQKILLFSVLLYCISLFVYSLYILKEVRTLRIRVRNQCDALVRELTLVFSLKANTSPDNIQRAETSLGEYMCIIKQFKNKFIRSKIAVLFFLCVATIKYDADVMLCYRLISFEGVDYIDDTWDVPLLTATYEKAIRTIPFEDVGRRYAGSSFDVLQVEY